MKTKPTINSKEFSLLKGFIEEKFGLALKNHHKESLAKKLEPNLQGLGVHSFSEYYDYLKNGSASQEDHFNLATVIVNMESYFLREKVQFDVFTTLLDHLLKKRIAKKKGAITILSAGCAAGQEPYSIRMAIQLSRIPLRQGDIRICGIDIDKSALEKARCGVYKSYSLRGLDKETTSLFFSPVDKDSYKIDQDIIDSVEFIQGNLLDPSVLDRVHMADFVFCRNVLIYMSNRAAHTIVRNLREVLSENGYLFIGQSEILPDREELFRAVHYPNVTVYQKIPNTGSRG